VPIKLIEQFSGGSDWKAPKTLSMEETWFKPEDQKPSLKIGDHLLISQTIDKKGSGGFVVALPLDKQSEAELAKSCRSIKDSRELPDVTQSLAYALATKDAVTQRFVLNELLGTDPKNLADSLLDQLVLVRNDKTIDVSVRLLASEVIGKVSAYLQKGDDWNWIANVLRNEQTLNQDQYKRLIKQMIFGHAERSAQSIDLLCDLANDLKRPAPLRQAIIRTAEITTLLDRENAENPKNLELVEMLINRLQDPEVLVREPASGALFDALEYLYSIKPRSNSVVEASRHAAQLLEAAVDKETDHMTKLGMANGLQRIQNMVKTADSEKPNP
jgi:hypothetical protein